MIKYVKSINIVPQVPQGIFDITLLNIWPCVKNTPKLPQGR